MRSVRIAIVGGGTAGACLVQSLTHELAEYDRVSLTILDSSEHLWCGSVFQPDGDEVLANLPMHEMSIRAWDSEHGTRWLRAQGHDSSHDHFPPRRVVGRYLQDTTGDTVQDARRMGWQIDVVQEMVLSAFEDCGRVHLKTASNTHAGFDFVVLTVGGGAPVDPFRLSGARGYLSRPYPLAASLEHVSTNARVAVLGTGLTAVDVVMGLQARGHQGPITLMSRRGLLPSVRRRPIRHRLRHLTVAAIEAAVVARGELTLSSLLGLAMDELTELNEDPALILREFSSDQNGAERLRDQLQSVDSEGIGWQVLQESVGIIGQDAWYFLRDSEKELVLGQFHNRVMSHCCPMSPPNARRLWSLISSRQVDIIGGVTQVDAGFEVTAGSRTRHFDTIINAITPAVHHANPEAQGLVDSLIHSGIASPHRFGGVQIDRASNRLIRPSGKRVPGVFALGDLTHGALFFTNGIPGIVDRSQRIAQSVARALSHGLGPTTFANQI